LFERPRSGERAAAVHVRIGAGDGEAQRDELLELIASAGAEVTGLVTARRDTPDPRCFIGSGKLAELRELVEIEGVEVAIFDQALSPAQERNLERELRCRVLDRISLILDIFAQRAHTFEGKLQVELAQLRHLSTRLVRGWTHLERQKGGIGLRGPGEKQLETDRRLLAERIRQIERRLEGVRNRRELSRRARRRAEVPLVALVGYTNAGKSTLFNRLTGAGVMQADRLFATLDPTLRRLELPGGGRAVVADTVGFIRHLPHELVAAFRATLEETREASLLLHVVDACDPEKDAKALQVGAVLEEIGADSVAQVIILNKIDRLPRTADGGVWPPAPRADRDADGQIERVWLSARTGEGVELLLEALAQRLGGARVRRTVHLPPSEGRLRARLFEAGKVLQERVGEGGTMIMDIELESAVLDRLLREEGLDRWIEQAPDDVARERKRAQTQLR
jgi:GTP-binding protein HflX